MFMAIVFCNLIKMLGKFHFLKMVVHVCMCAYCISYFQIVFFVSRAFMRKGYLEVTFFFRMFVRPFVRPSVRKFWEIVYNELLA